MLLGPELQRAGLDQAVSVMGSALDMSLHSVKWEGGSEMEGG